MLSLGLGLIAALAWGFHDVSVRFVVGRTGVLRSFGAVLAAGLILLLPFAALSGLPSDPRALGLSALGGLSYAGAGYALFRAFEIGPVRLVAPVIGAFPVLSIAVAALQGQSVSATQLLAVMAVVAGVGLCAALGDTEGAGHGDRRRAISWSLAAAVGFAATFALGQAGAAAGLWGPVAARVAALCVIGGALAVTREPRPANGGPFTWVLLILMGAADALAMTLTYSAGRLPSPEFAAVAASCFGVVTILLAWAFLKEAMRPSQWLAVGLVFAGIGTLAVA